jgi:hypothetical protein
MKTRGFSRTLAGATISLALALAACGGDEANDGTTTNPSPAAEAPDDSGSTSPNLSRFPPEFLQCLEDQGIDLESATDVSEVIHSGGADRCFDQLHGG